MNPDGTVVLNTADAPVPTGAVALGDPISRPTLTYSATLGGTPVTVAFLGMTPGQIALAQANIPVSRELAPGTYPLVITIGTAVSNGPLVTVTTPRP